MILRLVGSLKVRDLGPRYIRSADTDLLEHQEACELPLFFPKEH